MSFFSYSRHFYPLPYLSFSDVVSEDSSYATCNQSSHPFSHKNYGDLKCVINSAPFCTPDVSTGSNGHVSHREKSFVDMLLLPLASRSAELLSSEAVQIQSPQFSGLWLPLNIQSISKSFCYSPITSSMRWVEPTEYGVHIVTGQGQCCTGCPKGMLCRTNNGDDYTGRK